MQLSATCRDARPHLDESGLYLAWSAIPEFRGRENVIFSWYVFHRSRPLVNPAEVVAGYDRLDDWPRMFVRRFVGELMTAGEVRRLGSYLRQDLGIGLTPVRVRFPLHPEVNYSGMVPCSWRRQIFYLDAQPRHGIGVGFAAWYDRRHTLQDLDLIHLLQ